MKKSILSLFLAVLLAGMLMGMLAVSASAADLPLLYDEAGLLTESQAASVLSALENVSRKHNADIAVVTIDSLAAYGYTGYYAPMEFADDYFDYNGFGQGENRDGVVLLLAMETRDWWISTSGFGITAFTDYGIQWLGEKLAPNFSSGDYAAAFKDYAAYADSLFSMAEDGEAYDVWSDREPVKAFSLTRVIGSLIAGIVAAFIPVSGMKGKLKTVRQQNDASAYAKRDSLRVTRARDYFIGHNVTRTPRQTERSGSGGSSTHTSSSGSTHGGGGGKF